MILYYFGILLLSHLTIIYADIVSGRGYQTCSLVSTEIHCYGGSTGVYSDYAGSFKNPSSDHFSMDIAAFDFTNVATAQSNWTQINPSAYDIPLQPAILPQSTSVANQTAFLVYGGLTTDTNGNRAQLTYPTVAYILSNKTWTYFPTSVNYTTYGAIVDLESRLWTWGGYINGTVLASASISYLNYGTGTWTVGPRDPTQDAVYSGYTATLAKQNNRIYLIGGDGAFADPNRNPYAVDMLTVRWFDTLSNTWGVDKAATAGQMPIAARMYHTTTPIPNSNSFLIYGGEDPTTESFLEVIDYAYMYDFVAKSYTRLNLSASGAGPRSGHSAVAYKSYIMIMFGMTGQQRQLLQDFHVLNVTDVTQPTWLLTNTTNSTGMATSGSTHYLSTGAIAGIAVGAAIVGIALSAGLLYFLYRKRQQRKEFEVEHSDPRKHSSRESMINAAKFNDDFPTIDYPTRITSPSVPPATTLGSFPADAASKCESYSVSDGMTARDSVDHKTENAAVLPPSTDIVKPFEMISEPVNKPHGNI